MTLNGRQLGREVRQPAFDLNHRYESVTMLANHSRRVLHAPDVAGMQHGVVDPGGVHAGQHVGLGLAVFALGPVAGHMILWLLRPDVGVGVDYRKSPVRHVSALLESVSRSTRRSRAACCMATRVARSIIPGVSVVMKSRIPRS